MNFTVVMWWCGVVRAVGGGDMKIDVAVAPISCSGNFLTNHSRLMTPYLTPPNTEAITIYLLGIQRSFPSFYNANGI